MQHPTFDPDGQFLAAVSDTYVEKALRRGELVENEDGHLVVIPQPIKELDVATKQRIRQAKERRKR